MMDHVALVTARLEEMKEFYVRYFGGEARKWVSPDGQGVLYFIRYENGSMLEMEQNMEADSDKQIEKGSRIGMAHLAFRADSREEVRSLTRRIEQDGHTVVAQPTDYGCEGFYESCVLDPDGNYVEIVIDPGLFD